MTLKRKDFGLAKAVKCCPLLRQSVLLCNIVVVVGPDNAIAFDEGFVRLVENVG